MSVTVKGNALRVTVNKVMKTGKYFWFYSLVYFGLTAMAGIFHLLSR